MLFHPSIFIRRLKQNGFGTPTTWFALAVRAAVVLLLMLFIVKLYSDVKMARRILLQQRSASPNLTIFGKPPPATSEKLLHGRKFIAISSDDWGRWADSVALWPNAELRSQFKSRGMLVNHEVWQYGTVETAADLLNLYDFVDKLNHRHSSQKAKSSSVSASSSSSSPSPAQTAIPFSHQIVITPFWVIGGPDIQAMKKLGCPDSPNCDFREIFIHEGPGALAIEPYNRGDLRELYREGFNRGIWHPEYHARAHISVPRWMRMLKGSSPENGRDEWARECFAAGLICSSQYSGLRSEYTDFATQTDMETWMRGGVESFERFWGYRPTISSLPHNVSHPWLGTVTDNLNFIGVDTAIADPWGASGLLSTNDRIRFDTYWSNFNVTSRVADIVDSLEHKSPFALLMWHAQNALGSTYSPEQLARNFNTFAEGIRLLRESIKDLVFVTSSEFHQIKRKGWSQEIWSDHLLLRNYRMYPLKYVVPNLKELNSHAESWAGRDLQVIDMDNDIVVTVTRTDETIVLEPNRVYRVQLL